MPLLENRVAIVTGASRGIGRGVAIGLARAGAAVAITSRTVREEDAPRIAGGGERVPGSLAGTAAALQAEGCDAVSIPADLGTSGDIERLVDETRSRLGRIDIVVNCAMGFPEDYEGMEFWKSPVADWDAQNTVGVRSHYLLSRFAAPYMVAQGDGLIVNVSTAGAIAEYYNLGFRVAHAANTRLAKAMAYDLRDTGVAAISLWPRWVLTERVRLAVEKKHPGFNIEPEELEDADTPELVGAALAHLYADPRRQEKSGHVQLIAELADEYGLSEQDGKRPRIDDFTRQLRQRLDQIEAQLDW